jgi:hypothetical protein
MPNCFLRQLGVLFEPQDGILMGRFGYPGRYAARWRDNASDLRSALPLIDEHHDSMVEESYPDRKPFLARTVDEDTDIRPQVVSPGRSGSLIGRLGTEAEDRRIAPVKVQVRTTYGSGYVSSRHAGLPSLCQGMHP